MLLSAYISELQLLIHDSTFSTASQATLTSYVNRARKRLAKDSACCRFLLSGQGPLSGLTLVAGGTGYTNPVVTVTGNMGSGAVVTPTVVAGVITALTLAAPGNNFSPPLTVTITDPTGVGAAATAQQSANLLQTVIGQESYAYPAVNTLLQAAAPGFDSIIDVVQVAAAYAGRKPALGQITFGQMQAYMRSYGVPVLGQPMTWAKYGYSALGRIYLYQIPGQVAAMEWDCVCYPTPLVDDTTLDVIPDSHSGAVKYYAARLHYLNAQRYGDSDNAFKMYEDDLLTNNAAVNSPMIPSWYNNDEW